MSTTNAADAELWSIALSSGEIRKGTLDQLDEAFNAGLVNEDSLVLAPGATQWTRLGDLAGIDAPQAQVATGPQTLRPVVANLEALIEPPRPKSKTPIIAGIAGGIAAIAAVIAVAVSGGDASSTKAAAAGAITAPPKPTTVQKPAVPISDDAVPQKPVLTDAQKKALQEADEARAKLLKGKKGDRDTTGPYKPSKGISDSAGFSSPSKGHGKCTCRAGDPLCSCM